MVKSIQTMGALVPLLLIVINLYLKTTIPLDVSDPNHLMLRGSLFVTYFFYFGFSILFVLPTLCILSKAENREYFKFTSKFWLAVLAINWLVQAIYVLLLVFYIVANFSV